MLGSRGAAGDTLQCRLALLAEASFSPQASEQYCADARISAILSPEGPCTEAPSTPADCGTYCELVMAACSDDLAVYESERQCQQVCAHLALGEFQYLDVNNPTVGCRRYHAYAALAVGQDDYHCPHAGPTGDGVCGTDNCEAFCQLFKVACPENNARSADCRSECSTLDGHAGSSGYAVPAPAAPNLRCRTYHTVEAIEALNAGDEASRLAECTAASGGGDCGF